MVIPRSYVTTNNAKNAENKSTKTKHSSNDEWQTGEQQNAQNLFQTCIDWMQKETCEEIFKQTNILSASKDLDVDLFFFVQNFRAVKKRVHNVRFDLFDLKIFWHMAIWIECWRIASVGTVVYYVLLIDSLSSCFFSFSFISCLTHDRQSSVMLLLSLHIPFTCHGPSIFSANWKVHVKIKKARAHTHVDRTKQWYLPIWLTYWIDSQASFYLHLSGGY